MSTTPLELVYWPHPVLRRKAAALAADEFTPELARTVEEMIRVMHAHRGIGLAAPQVAIGKRFLVCTPSGEGGDEILVANPRILELDGEQLGDEGCLSFPQIFGKVPRAATAVVEAQDVTGARVIHEATGLFARCLQHEIDHLDGLLFIQRMTPGARIQAKRKLRELENRWGPIYSQAAPPVEA